MVFFTPERNGEAAAQDVRDKVSTVLSQLPPGTDSPVAAQFDIEGTPILSIVVSGNRDLREITEIAKKQIKEDIETQRGVGSGSLVGGPQGAITSDPDTHRV